MKNHPSWKNTIINQGKKLLEKLIHLILLLTHPGILSDFVLKKYSSAPFEEKKQLLDACRWYIGGVELQFYIYFIHVCKGISKCNKNFNVTEPFKNLFTQGMVCHEYTKILKVIGFILMKLKRLTQKLLKKLTKAKLKLVLQNLCLNPKKIL